MNYVADTHALFFFAGGKAARMSRKCAQIFRRAEQQRDRVHVLSSAPLSWPYCWSGDG